MSFKRQLQEKSEAFSQALEKTFKRYAFDQPTQAAPLTEAVGYSLLSPGKRIRPILFMETLRLCKKDPEDFFPMAFAIEMIHSYSLIHDDLPAMDNDILRRGKPTNHVLYGEGMAILAGDALLNLAFEMLFEQLKQEFHPQVLASASFLARAAGLSGMVGGQSADLLSEKACVDESSMKYIHQHKTGALLEACVRCACSCASLEGEGRVALERYAKEIGLAFQIADDILDVVSNSASLGKTPGKDQQAQKATYPSLYGLQESKRRLALCVEQAVTALEYFPMPERQFLTDLAYFVASREA